MFGSSSLPWDGQPTSNSAGAKPWVQMYMPKVAQYRYDEKRTGVAYILWALGLN